MTAGYLCAIAIAVVFMLYMDGAIGVMMLAFLLLMPVLSLCVTLWVRRSLQISLQLPDTAGKQRAVDAMIVLRKDTILPLPFLRLELIADAHFAPLSPEADPLPERPLQTGSFQARRAEKIWRTKARTQLTPDCLPLCLSMGTNREAVYRIRLVPQYCGSGEIQLRKLVLSDYLAMIRFRIKQEQTKYLLITPEIPELKANSNLFRSVSTAVAAADDESDATPSFSASSMPGYEHRGYIPGDSLKRINWKLSSKRRQLMVRQDEPISLARLSVILDFRRDDAPLSAVARIQMEEQLIETTLGFLRLCAQYGYPCRLQYVDLHGAWTDLEIDDGGQLEVDAINLLRGGFRGQADMAGCGGLPPMQEAGAVLLYMTTMQDAAAVSVLESQDAQVYLVVPERLAGQFHPPKNGWLWCVTADRQLASAQ